MGPLKETALAQASPCSDALMSDTDAKYFVRVKMLDDGRIQNDRFEGMALLMADGLTEQKAWTQVNGNNSADGSRAYRRKALAHPVFKLRMEDLMAEKSELEKDPLFGQAIWMANQTYRHAVNIGDVNMMERAAKMRLDAAKAMQAANGGPAKLPGTPPDPANRGPGAPVAEMQQHSRSMSDLRKQFALKGMKPPAEEEEDDEVPDDDEAAADAA